jgi:hypothetical protein
MGKSIFKFFSKRKDRRDRSSIVGPSSEHLAALVPSKLSRSRNSISTAAPNQRKSILGVSFSSSKFDAKQESNRAPTTSEASTAPSNSHKDGACDRLSEGMENKDDALLGTAIVPLVGSHENYGNSLKNHASEAAETPDYSDEGEDPHLISSYGNVPVLEQTKLPRGGVSIETKAVGRVQVCPIDDFVIFLRNLRVNSSLKACFLFVSVVWYTSRDN